MHLVYQESQDLDARGGYQPGSDRLGLLPLVLITSARCDNMLARLALARFDNELARLGSLSKRAENASSRGRGLEDARPPTAARRCEGEGWARKSSKKREELRNPKLAASKK